MLASNQNVENNPMQRKHVVAGMELLLDPLETF
jgi:hypothetical protein